MEQTMVSLEKKIWGMKVDNYCACLHIAQLSHFLIPGAGFVIPVVMWVTNKEEDSRIDRHGRVVINWIASSFIYMVICLVLMIVLIGIPMLIVLGLLSITFSIIGCLKAAKGQTWKYPLSISFLKVSKVSDNVIVSENT